MRQIRGNREINGVFFTIWSTHKKKSTAKEEAQKLRNMGKLARVVKSKEKGIENPWVVFYGEK